MALPAQLEHYYIIKFALAICDKQVGRERASSEGEFSASYLRANYAAYSKHIF